MRWNEMKENVTPKITDEIGRRTSQLDFIRCSPLRSVCVFDSFPCGMTSTATGYNQSATRERWQQKKTDQSGSKLHCFADDPIKLKRRPSNFHSIRSPCCLTRVPRTKKNKRETQDFYENKRKSSFSATLEIRVGGGGMTRWKMFG